MELQEHATATQKRTEDFIALEIMDRYVHWYPAVKKMYDRYRLHEDNYGPDEAFDYFDVDRYRLAPSFDEDGRIVSLWRTQEQVGEEYLQGRLQTAIDRCEQNSDPSNRK